MWREPTDPDPVFTDTLELDLAAVLPSLAGPKRPQDRVVLTDAAAEFKAALAGDFGKAGHDGHRVTVEGENFDVGHGDVVIAAITSCTNTSNPSVLIAAGLVAKKAVEKGLQVKPWVKTSLAPGSQVVTDYLKAAGLTKTWTRWASTWWATAAPPASATPARCRSRSPRPSRRTTWSPCSVLSGNRNFEGRVNPDVRANYLASPPLVVAYALAGSMQHRHRPPSRSARARTASRST